jgi:excisionase family DNA binding protein
MRQTGAEKQMKTSASKGTSANRTSNSIVYQSVDELASEIKVSRHAVYAGLRKGTIPHIRLGKRFVISREAIANWLSSGGKA